MNFIVSGINPPLKNASNQTLFEIITFKSITVFGRKITNLIPLSETRVITIENCKLSIDNLKRRYKNMADKTEKNIEKISSEINDDYSDDSLFNIASWGADLSFRELISMYDDNELVKPELQRKYVWDKVEASRFVESVLLGLPVPSIFLAQSGSEKLIVDGYQRIMTIYDYVRGIFTTDGKVFKLSNSDKINSRWRNKAFSELTTDEQRKIKSTTIHAIVFEQKKPENDDTSLYQVFERINTSGRSLMAQEIRNCVYQGSFNSLLFELNENELWRGLFGVKDTDSRMRDIEYILRFFALKSDIVMKSTSSQISLKKTLNEFMQLHKSADDTTIETFKKEFEDTVEIISNRIGKNAFRNYTTSGYSKKFHPAIFDAIMIASFNNRSSSNARQIITNEQHIALLKNEEFKKATSTRTTDLENIRTRIALAERFIFGVDTNEG